MATVNGDPKDDVGLKCWWCGAKSGNTDMCVGCATKSMIKAPPYTNPADGDYAELWENETMAMTEQTQPTDRRP